MQIKGVDNLTVGEVQHLVRQGGRFVTFAWCLSLLLVTFRRSSDIYFVKPGEGTFGLSLPYTLLSFFLGWWGFPWGLVYTPMAIIQNLGGGKDVTAEVLNLLASPQPQAAHPGAH